MAYDVECLIARIFQITSQYFSACRTDEEKKGESPN